MIKLSLSLTNKTSYKLPSKKLIEDFVIFVLNEKKITGEIEIGLNLINKNEMQKLNLKFREKDYPTDVLSFPIFKKVPTKNEIPTLIGDLFICPDVMIDNSKLYHIDLKNEFENLVKHGVLHLLGFHHLGDE